MNAIFPVEYHSVRMSLKTGDILLSRASGIAGRAINDVTDSEYSHATMIGYAGIQPHSVLMLGETREHKDARLISLSAEVKAWPGYYDVYRIRRKAWYPDLAWAFMCRAAGSRYSWRHILRVFLRRKLGERIPPLPNSESPQCPRDCSALVHAAIQHGGGPKFREFDCDVVPGDLANPKFCTYKWTLFWSHDQIAEAYP
jgi:hypothetical protein